MKPTIGRIVHVQGRDGCWAAIVTDVITDDTLHLTIFAPNTTPYPQRAVKLGISPDTWHWPERA